MLSSQYKIIFIHIPRTGGSSIERSFGVDMWQSTPNEKHLSAFEVKVKVGKERWEEYYKFTVIRNPWDRVISLMNSGYYGKYSNLYEFLIKYEPAAHEYKNYQYYKILNAKLDYIVRFENLQKDADFVRKKIGLSPSVLPHHEKSEHNSYITYYNCETFSIVNYLYWVDIRKYDYSFDNGVTKINVNKIKQAYYVTKYIILRNMYICSKTIKIIIRKIKNYYDKSQ